MLSFRAGVLQGPAVEEWVLGILRARGPQTLAQLEEALPVWKWAQLLLAIDRLSRQGAISLRRHDSGGYLIALMTSWQN
jgi:hypothetical protein